MRWLAVGLVCASLLAGCAADVKDPVDGRASGPDPTPSAGPASPVVPATPSPAAKPAAPLGPAKPAPEDSPDVEDGAMPGATRWLEDGTLAVDVPVDVVLLGYPAGTAAALAEKAGSFTVHSDVLHDLEDMRGTLPDPAYTYTPQGVTNHVRIRYIEAEPSLEAFFGAEPAGLMDGNAVEQAAFELAVASGARMTAATPGLFLANAGASYRYDFENGGWLQPVRTFGGRLPLVYVDTAAPVDPWVGDGEDHDSPVGAGDVAGLASLVEASVRFRFAQGAIYPPALPTCHAVTVLHAVRVTGSSGLLSGITPEEAMDGERLQAHFAELTHEQVFVDVTTLELPQDDPALEALLRMVAANRNGAGAMYIAEVDPVEAVRTWVEDNWDTYMVPHEGCEEYLSLVAFGDYFDGTFGIAMHDAGGTRRFSFSVVSEGTRAYYEAGPVGGLVFGSAPDSYGTFQFDTFLAAHETGHLFGQAHPHNFIDGQDGQTMWTFSPTLTAMSYQTGDRTTEFGLVDQANWARNRIGVLADALREAGLQDDARLRPMLDELDAHDWWTAYALGAAVLAEA